MTLARVLWQGRPTLPLIGSRAFGETTDLWRALEGELALDDLARLERARRGLGPVLAPRPLTS